MLKEGAQDLGGGVVDKLPKKIELPRAKPETENAAERQMARWTKKTDATLQKIRGNDKAKKFLETIGIGDTINAQALSDKYIEGDESEVDTLIKTTQFKFNPAETEQLGAMKLLCDVLDGTEVGDKMQELFAPHEKQWKKEAAKAKRRQKARLAKRERQQAPWKRRAKLAGKILSSLAAISTVIPTAASDQTDHDIRVQQIQHQIDNHTYNSLLPNINVPLAQARSTIEEMQLAISKSERPLVVTNEDITTAFNNLQPFLRGYHETQIFNNSPMTGARPAYSWEEQHPLSAITSYEMVHGSLPEGMPDPTTVAAQYWGDGGRSGDNPKGYYIDAGHDSGKLYTDDGLWLANLEMDRVELLRSQGRHAEADASIYRAREMFNTSWKNWGAVNGGGIRWLDVDGDQDPSEQKTLTVSNGGAIELAMKLYQLDPAHGKDYLDKAQAIYSWVRGNLYDQQDHLYYDNIDLPTGQINHDKVSYAQGVMINSGILLADVTGNQQYLQDAQETARQIIDHGNMTQNPNLAFDAILIKSFLRLYAVTQDQDLQRDIKDTVIKYANDLVRDPRYWDRNQGAYIHEQSRNGGLIHGQGGGTEILTLASFLGDNSLTMQEKITLILAFNHLHPATQDNAQETQSSNSQ